MIARDIHREGEVFWFNMKSRGIATNANVFLIVSRTFHDESNQEVWLAVELETGEQTVFSEDFLKIREKSSRLT